MELTNVLTNAQPLQLHRRCVLDSRMPIERSPHFYSTKTKCHLTAVDLSEGFFDRHRPGHIGIASVEIQTALLVRGCPSTSHAAMPL